LKLSSARELFSLHAPTTIEIRLIIFSQSQAMVSTTIQMGRLDEKIRTHLYLKLKPNDKIV